MKTPIPEGSSPITLTREPIELYKILKFESLVNSGGEAKLVIEQGLVSVNGEVETQKRKKIQSGDSIEFQDAKFLMVLDPAFSASSENLSAPPKPKLPKTKRSAIPALSGRDRK